MSQCKNCKNSYHTCSSCDLRDWEWDYCSLDCFNKVKNKLEIEMKNFLNSLSTYNKNKLFNWIDSDWKISLLETLLSIKE